MRPPSCWGPSVPLLILLLTAVAGRNSAAAEAVEAPVQELRVGALPSAIAPTAASLGSIYTVPSGKNVQVVHVLLGVGPEVTGFEFANLRVNEDARHIAYPARSGKRTILVVDQKPAYPDHTPVAAAPQFSPDGTHLAFIATRNGKEYVVVDGRAGREHKAIGRHGGLSFDQSGTRFAYLARDGNKWFAVVDGVPGREYHDIFYPGVQFDSTGAHVVYAVKQSNKSIVVFDGVEGAPAEGVHSIALSPTGGRLAYAVVDEKSARMVLDGVPGPAYKRVGSPTFSRDGRHFAYIAVKEGGIVPVVDGAEAPALESMSAVGVIWSRDGARNAYVAGVGGRWKVVIDGKEGPLHPNIQSRTPVFSADGSHVAYVAIAADSSCRSVVDGTEAGPLLTDVDTPSLLPFFTESGWHVASRTRDATRVVVDGRQGPRYERVLLPILETQGGVRYHAARGDTLFDVRQSF